MIHRSTIPRTCGTTSLPTRRPLCRCHIHVTRFNLADGGETVLVIRGLAGRHFHERVSRPRGVRIAC